MKKEWNNLKNGINNNLLSLMLRKQ